MEIKDFFSIWNKLSESEKNYIEKNLQSKTFKKGSLIHDYENECAGLIFVKSGQLRAYILSDEGKEITVYRLFDYDICLFSAACVLKSIQFNIVIEADKDTEVWLLAPYVFKELMERSLVIANYVNEIMATRFSDVMWLLEQIMWKSLDKRLANFLVEESAIEDTPILQITHENIANHLGSPREVITRMLRYFQSEGLVRLARGSIELIEPDRLESLANE